MLSRRHEHCDCPLRRWPRPPPAPRAWSRSKSIRSFRHLLTETRRVRIVVVLHRLAATAIAACATRVSRGKPTPLANASKPSLYFKHSFPKRLSQSWNAGGPVDRNATHTVEERLRSERSRRKTTGCVRKNVSNAALRTGVATKVATALATELAAALATAISRKNSDTETFAAMRGGRTLHATPARWLTAPAHRWYAFELPR